ncbi:hypothetical protein OKA06_04350 [Novosphingobium sp. MW5]|nr:hypothetical protein [Novosphingobium sp. MW5]
MRENKERSSDSWPVTAATELPVDPSQRPERELARSGGEAVGLNPRDFG